MAIYVTHQLVVLGYRNRDPLDIRLLEAIAANQGADHLASDADERDGVHEGVGDAGHQVGRPGARRAVADARLAGYAGVGVGGVGGALLVLHQVMLNRVYLGLDAGGQRHNPDAAGFQDVVQREVGAPGNAEDGIDAFAQEGLHHHLGACIFAVSVFRFHGFFPHISFPV